MVRQMDAFFSVVVAEDNPDDAFILQRAFKTNGLQRPIHILKDGAEVLAYLKGEEPYADRIAHPFPDLLILDLKMPIMSGFEVLEWIHNNPDYRVIPAVVWSASSDRRDVKHAFCLGAHGYFRKPSGYDECVDMVRRLIEFWSVCEKPGVAPMEPACETLSGRDPFSAAQFS